jgi:hypothetical protein
MTAIFSIRPVAAVGDPLSRHLELVSAVRPFAPPPAEWDSLVRRLRDFRAQGSTPMRDKLIDAILRGGADEARIAELRALAESEAAPINPTLMQIVQGAVQAELFAIYEPIALDAYTAVAEAFDERAAKFAAAAAKVDVELDSEAVVGLPAAARTGWIDAVGHAGALDELLVLLVAAAELAGVIIDSDELLIRLIIRDAVAGTCIAESCGPRSPRPTPLRRRSIGCPSGRSRASGHRRGAGAGRRWPSSARRSAPPTSPRAFGPSTGRPPMDRRERRAPGQVGNEVLWFDPCDSDYLEQLASAGFPPREGVDYAAAAS